MCYKLSIKVANEIKKSHFTLGSHKEGIPESLSKASFQEHQINNKETSAQQAKMIKFNRKSNFILGTDSWKYSESSSNQDFKWN